MKKETVISNFISVVWNALDYQKLEEFIHPDYVDHALPLGFAKDINGLKAWIIATSNSFEHRTIIEDQVCENDKFAIRISMQLKHIGVWRGIEPTGKEITVNGYRLYKLKEGKIVAHWGLIDGQSIANQLQETTHSCSREK